MAMIYSSIGLKTLQEDMINESVPDDYTMVLYTAGIPSASAVLGDFTEVIAAGYAEVDMIGSSWTVTDASPSVASYPQITFTLTEASTVVGYLIKKNTILIGAEDFSDGPYVIPSTGGTITNTFTQSLT